MLVNIHSWEKLTHPSPFLSTDKAMGQGPKLPLGVSPSFPQQQGWSSWCPGKSSSFFLLTCWADRMWLPCCGRPSCNFREQCPRLKLAESKAKLRLRTFAWPFISTKSHPPIPFINEPPPLNFCLCRPSWAMITPFISHVHPSKEDLLVTLWSRGQH